MLFRGFSMCCSYEKFHEEIAKLKEKKIIEKCIKKFLSKLHVPKVVEFTTARKELLVLPYLVQSFEIRNRIQCCLKKTLQFST